MQVFEFLNLSHRDILSFLYMSDCDNNFEKSFKNPKSIEELNFNTIIFKITYLNNDKYHLSSE